MRYKLAVFASAAILCLAACTSEPAPAELTPEARDAVQRSIEKVARDHDLSATALTVVAVEARDWPSSALGFPRAGVAYATVIVPGHRVALRLPDGTAVVCHTSSDRVVADYEVK